MFVVRIWFDAKLTEELQCKLKSNFRHRVFTLNNMHEPKLKSNKNKE